MKLNPDDESSYKFGLEVYKSAITLYNIKHDLETGNNHINMIRGKLMQNARKYLKTSITKRT